VSFSRGKTKAGFESFILQATSNTTIENVKKFVTLFNLYLNANAQKSGHEIRYYYYFWDCLGNKYNGRWIL
jgi:hypothetical protein